MPYDPRYMVKQWLGEVKGEHGWFRVFATGDPRYVLFQLINEPGGYTMGLDAFPVLRRDLKPEVKRALGRAS